MGALGAADGGLSHRLSGRRRLALLEPWWGRRDRAQPDWLTAEADRTGLTCVALLKKLVDDARTNRAA